MQTSDFLMLLGGLALFLYGMDMMSGAMEPLRDSPTFTQLVTDFERIGDHALNIAEEYSVIA